MFLDKIELESDEVVIAQVRRHWFVLFLQLLGPIIAGFMPIVLLLVVLSAGDSVIPELNIRAYFPHISFLYALWLLLLWLGAFNLWTNYYLDILTVTNRRVILVNQKGFWKRNVGSFRLERLQDLNVEIDGILATLLDFGSLTAETAGHSDEGFKTYGLPHPRELKATIIKATDELIESYREMPLRGDGIS